MIYINKSLVHFIAECTVCGWKTENYLTGQQEAFQHVVKTGHKIKADLGYVAEYGAQRGGQDEKEA